MRQHFLREARTHTPVSRYSSSPPRDNKSDSFFLFVLQSVPVTVSFTRLAALTTHTHTTPPRLCTAVNFQLRPVTLRRSHSQSPARCCTIVRCGFSPLDTHYTHYTPSPSHHHVRVHVVCACDPVPASLHAKSPQVKSQHVQVSCTIRASGSATSVHPDVLPVARLRVPWSRPASNHPRTALLSACGVQ